MTNVVEACNLEGRQERLDELLAQLEMCEKALQVNIKVHHQTFDRPCMSAAAFTQGELNQSIAFWGKIDFFQVLKVINAKLEFRAGITGNSCCCMLLIIEHELNLSSASEACEPLHSLLDHTKSACANGSLSRAEYS